MPRPAKTILIWSFILIAILMVGAVIDNAGVSGTCMFILIPYFAAIAATIPVLKVRRVGTGILVFVPYTLVGFVPMYIFDWKQNASLVGLWAVFAAALISLFIGASLDLAWALSHKSGEKTRAIAIGATMQAATFVVMFITLKFLYLPASDMAAHVHFFDRQWFFTLPWMALNGAFGGYTAYFLTRPSTR
jgi:hypothetical protein